MILSVEILGHGSINNRGIIKVIQPCIRYTGITTSVRPADAEIPHNAGYANQLTSN